MEYGQTVESVQVAKISASSIVVYNKQLEIRPRTALQQENEVNLRDNEFNGFMSPKTACKVRKMLDSWITGIELQRQEISQGNYWRNSKITFVTLTLSAKQFHSDNEVKRKMLNRFLIEAKREWQINTYFWRAEPQKKGNIHFHILIDKFIDWQVLRQKWNNIQNDFGYIDLFEKKNGHRNPNSTDIHGLEKLHSVSAYIVKYCCKVKAGRKIDGRIWGCSDNLRKLTCYETYITNQVRQYIDEVKKDKNVKVVKTEDFELIFCNNQAKLRKFSTALYREWKSHYSEVFTSLYTESGRAKIQREIEAEKTERQAQRTNIPIGQDGRGKVLVSSQLFLFAPSNLAMLR